MSNLVNKQTVITKTSLNYAKVMYDMKLAKDTVDRAKRVCECSEFMNSISNPSIDFDQKIRVIDRLFDSSISGLMKAICKNQDMHVLELLFIAYEYICNKRNSVLFAILEYYDDINSDKIEALKNMLKKKYNVKDIKLELVKNKKLIGGFKMYINDEVYDTSVSGILKRMQKTLFGGDGID